MTFEQFMRVKIGGLALMLWALAWVLGMMLSREKSMRRRIDTLTDKLRDVKPTDRLPSKREKRKMKSHQREIRKVKDEATTLHRNRLVLDVVYAGIFVALAIFVMPNGGAIAIAFLLGVMMVGVLIFNTVANNWRTSSITTFCLCGVALIMLIGMAADREMRIIHEAAAPTEATQEVMNEEPNEGSGGPSEVGPENPELGEMTDDWLVSAILRDTENVYYDRHVAELLPYTDEFGLDLDKMLKDYGYEFIAYGISDATGEISLEPPRTQSYWMIFGGQDSLLMIHTCGGWVVCANDDGNHLMMPSVFELPEIAVSLRERMFVVNHKVLALVMEFLEGQPKVVPRDAREVAEFKV